MKNPKFISVTVFIIFFWDCTLRRRAKTALDRSRAFRRTGYPLPLGKFQKGIIYLCESALYIRNLSLVGGGCMMNKVIYG